MKRTLLTLAVACAMMANLSPSLVNAPVIQAQAQSSSTVSSIISTIISVISDIFGGGKKYKAEERIGTKDCSDKLVYYYKLVPKEDGTYDKQYVGRMEIRKGEVVVNPPMSYDTSELQYHHKHIGKQSVICTGESTSTPCSPGDLTCEEQFP